MSHTILIIEDDTVLRDGLKMQLEKDGFQTLVADTGTQGLEIARSKHPHLILLDVIIPEIDGLSVLSQLRSDPVCKQTPIMMLTSITDNDHMMEAQKLGVTDFLVKTDWTFQDISKQVTKRLSVSDKGSNHAANMVR